MKWCALNQNVNLHPYICWLDTQVATDTGDGSGHHHHPNWPSLWVHNSTHCYGLITLAYATKAHRYIHFFRLTTEILSSSAAHGLVSMLVWSSCPPSELKGDSMGGNPWRWPCLRFHRRNVVATSILFLSSLITLHHDFCSVCSNLGIQTYHFRNSLHYTWTFLSPFRRHLLGIVVLKHHMQYC